MDKHDIEPQTYIDRPRGHKADALWAQPCLPSWSAGEPLKNHGPLIATALFILSIKKEGI